MDNISTNTKKKKKKNRMKQLGSSTERKASGCNWEIYKNLFSKSEESNGERIASQNRYPKPRNMLTNPFQKVNT